MYVYMGHLKFQHTQPYEDDFWKKNRIELKHARVQSVDTKNKNLQFPNGSTLTYYRLIIATGSKSNRFGWKGQDA